MQKNAIALILIIIGLIVIAFPIIGLVPVAILSGFLVSLLGIGLILSGITEIKEGPALGISLLILGIISFILGIGFIFSPQLFTWIVSLIIWIIGLILIIEGIVRIISKTGINQCGIKDIILGILILLVGIFLAAYTWLLGVIIGLWMITTGLRMLMKD